MRVWAIADNRSVRVLSKVDRKTEMVAGVQDQVAAPPGQAGTIGYFPLADGNMLAIDLAGGTTEGGVNQLWRVNVGGILNHLPVVTRDAVFASGDHSGVARVDRTTGELAWRTESMADLVLAVNEEFAYVRDRQGRLLIYDVRRATDPARRMSVPLTGYNFPEFNVPVVNTLEDNRLVGKLARAEVLALFAEAIARSSQPAGGVTGPSNGAVVRG